MNFLQKLALLILLGSTAQCTKISQTESSNKSEYTDSVLELHDNLRKQIKPFNDSISLFGDTVAFFSRVHPILLATDAYLASNALLKPKTRQDSLVFVANERLNQNYKALLYKGYRDLFAIYNSDSISDEAKQTATEIMNTYLSEDSLAVGYFNSLLDKSSIKLAILKPSEAVK